MKNLYLEIGIDGTTSMKHIYPAVYRFLKQSFELLGGSAGRSNTTVHYGLSFFYGMTREKPADCETVTFKNGELFTEDTDEVLDKIFDLELSGGDPSGYEPYIITAIAEMLKKLQKAGDPDKDEDSRGMLFFSDSLPSKEVTAMKYDRIDRLRFAHLFIYDDSCFVPVIPTANRQNNAVDGSSAVTVYSIKNILESGIRTDKVEELLGVIENTSLNS